MKDFSLPPVPVTIVKEKNLTRLLPVSQFTDLKKKIAHRYTLMEKQNRTSYKKKTTLKPLWHVQKLTVNQKQAKKRAQFLMLYVKPQHLVSYACFFGIKCKHVYGILP